jgi:hypothetical protein
MTQALTFDGKTVIPIFSRSPGYREWELTLDGQDFCIVNEDGEDGEWILRQWMVDSSVANPPYKCWQEIGSGMDIDAFLTAHHLLLGH